MKASIKNNKKIIDDIETKILKIHQMCEVESDSSLSQIE